MSWNILNMKLKDLHKAAVIYKEIMDIDKQIKKMTEYAKHIADQSDKMQLIISVKLSTPPAQELNFFTPMGEPLSMMLSTPASRAKEQDVLNIDIDQADVLRVLQLLLVKKKEEKFYLFEQTKNI